MITNEQRITKDVFHQLSFNLKSLEHKVFPQCFEHRTMAKHVLLQVLSSCYVSSWRAIAAQKLLQFK